MAYLLCYSIAEGRYVTTRVWSLPTGMGRCPVVHRLLSCCSGEDGNAGPTGERLAAGLAQAVGAFVANSGHPTANDLPAFSHHACRLSEHVFYFRW